MQLRPRGLRARSLVLVLLTIVPFVAFVFFTASDERAHLEEDAEESAVLLARLAADDVEVEIEGMRQVLMTFSLEEETLAGQEGPCRRQLGRLLATEEAFVNIGVARRDGTIPAAAGPGPGPAGPG